MKRPFSLCVAFFLLSVSVFAGDRKYVIRQMNCPSIEIGDTSRKIGDYLYEDEVIKWSFDDQRMVVQDESTHKIHIISRKAFESRLVRTIEDYFLTVNMSTRSAHNNFSPKKDIGISENRIALIVGNSNYESLPFLANPQNDAISITKRLNELGFNTYTYYDLNNLESRSVLNEFADQSKECDVALVYYAGHGVSWNGHNYYIPVDVPINDQSSLQSCINDSFLIERLRHSKREVTLLFMDACRTMVSLGDMESSYKSAFFESPEGFAVFLSTQDGRPAVDNVSGFPNSPFASAFLEYSDIEGLSILQMAPRITSHISKLTGAHQVSPMSSSLQKDFFFKPVMNLSQSGRQETELTVTGTNEQETRANNQLEEWVRIGDDYYYGRGVTQNFEESVVWYKKAAVEGHAKAQYYVGCAYNVGEGVELDYSESNKWFKLAAEQGSVESYNHLGQAYEYGRGVKVDYDEAFKWHMKAAEKNYAYSVNDIGRFYYNGNSVAQSYEKAVEWYKKAAELGSVHSMVNLGYCYLYGKGVAKDEAESVKWYMKSAEKGHAYGQYFIARAYRFGKGGLIINYKDAIKWYEMAIDNGDVVSIADLGDMFYYGEGSERDYEKAVEYYTRAANLGNISAMKNLAKCYNDGTGVPKDPNEELSWYKKAAEHKDVQAQTYVGSTLLFDFKNYKEALAWYQLALDNPSISNAQKGQVFYYMGLVYLKSGPKNEKDNKTMAKLWQTGAELGNIHCLANLAWCYETGTGIDKDMNKALQLHEEAANQGEVHAMCNWGKIHYFGRPGYVEINKTIGLKWLEKAAAAGDKNAKDIVAKIYSNSYN